MKTFRSIDCTYGGSRPIQRAYRRFETIVTAMEICEEMLRDETFLIYGVNRFAVVCDGAPTEIAMTCHLPIQMDLSYKYIES